MIINQAQAALPAPAVTVYGGINLYGMAFRCPATGIQVFGLGGINLAVSDLERCLVEPLALGYGVLSSGDCVPEE